MSRKFPFVPKVAGAGDPSTDAANRTSILAGTFPSATILAGALLTVAILIVGIAKPYTDYVARLDQRILKDRADLQRYEALIPRSAAAQEQLNRLRLTDPGAPANPANSEQETARLIKAVEIVSRDSALTLRHLRSVKNGVEIEAEGTIIQIASFLKNLQRPTFAIRVQKYGIAAGSQDSPLTARFTLTRLRR